MQSQVIVQFRMVLAGVIALMVTVGCQQEAEQPGESIGEVQKLAARSDNGLPAGWKLVEQPTISRQQAAAIGQKLGGAIEELVNAIYTVDGERFQVNTITCPGPGDAVRVAAALRKVHGGAHFRVLQDNHTVLEFVSQDPRLVERGYRDLGLTASTVRYRVKFQVAPLKKIQYMSWNPLFNALIRNREDRIRELSGDVEFGKAFSLRLVGQGGVDSVVQVAPKASRQVAVLGGDGIRYEFDEPGDRNGIPVVDVEMEVTSQGFAITPASEEASEMTTATRTWPSESKAVVELAEEIYLDVEGSDARVQALLNWLRPGANMRYAGTPAGSRYGVEQVLKQRYGHCWDFADLFITLARAGGVPCRQVYGWLHGSSGHVWVEVLTDAGWRAVDPTAGMGCDSRYIPLFHSDDGMIDLVYTSYPRITILSGP